MISVLLLMVTTFVANVEAQTLLASYNWKYLDYQYSSQAARDSAIYYRQYIKGNSFPIDIDVHYGGLPLQLHNVWHYTKFPLLLHSFRNQTIRYNAKIFRWNANNIGNNYKCYFCRWYTFDCSISGL